MNQLVNQPGAQLPAVAAPVPSYLQAAVENVDNTELSAGLTSALRRISFRGGSFRIMDGNVESHIFDYGIDPQGNLVQTQVARMIHVVILKGNPHLSKTYYEAQYQEGSNASPDCTSSNGLTPDAHITNPQCADCASCEKNAWGSKISPSGKQIKACSDQKRIAVLLIQPGKTLAESPVY